MRFPFLLAPGLDRIAVQEALVDEGVPTRMIWTGNILRQPGFAAISHRQPAGGLPNADLVMDRGLALPSHNALGEEGLAQVLEGLATCLAAL